MRTAEVNAALRRFYKSGEYALMFEVGNTTGTSVRRHADAVAVNLWPSRGLAIEGIEVKVSRSDWRTELANPAKSEPVQKFCDYWWIVAPEGIVQEHELPPLWGLRTVSEKTGAIRTVKAAPKLDAEPVSKGFLAAMLRRASDADAAVVDALVNAKLVVEQSKIEERVAREVERRAAKFTKIEKTIEEFKALGINLEAYHVSAAEIAEAYKLGSFMRKTYTLGGLDNTAARLEDAAKVLRDVHERLSPPSTNS